MVAFVSGVVQMAVDFSCLQYGFKIVAVEQLGQCLMIELVCLVLEFLYFDCFVGRHILIALEERNSFKYAGSLLKDYIGHLFVEVVGL